MKKTPKHGKDKGAEVTTYDNNDDSATVKGPDLKEEGTPDWQLITEVGDSAERLRLLSESPTLLPV